MERIGEKVGDAEASPALAWLLDAAQRSGEQRAEPRGQRLPLRRDVAALRRVQSQEDPAGAGRRFAPQEVGLTQVERVDHNPRDWVVRTDVSSPVVMDMIAGEGMAAAKSYQGYFLSGGAGAERTGRAVLVLYNFADQPAEVRIEAAGDFLEFPEGLMPKVAERGGPRRALSTIRPTLPGARLVLAPGERRELAVRLRAPWGELMPLEARLRAVVRVGAGLDSIALGDPALRLAWRAMRRMRCRRWIFRPRRRRAIGRACWSVPWRRRSPRWWSRGAGW